jgi:hypothetical protein
MTPRLLKLGSVVFIAVSTVGCAYALSPMQRRAVTSRVLVGPYEDVYRAALTVLQDRGYQIERTDLDTGLLRGRRPEHDVAVGGAGAAILGLAIAAAAIIADEGPEFDSDSGAVPMLDLTFVVSAVDGDRTEVRALLVGQSGNVYDIDFYERLFTEVSVEVQRRAATSGGTRPDGAQGELR